jgi:hypothetical protein
MKYALTQFFIFYLFASSLDLNNNNKKKIVKFKLDNVRDMGISQAFSNP